MNDVGQRFLSPVDEGFYQMETIWTRCMVVSHAILQMADELLAANSRSSYRDIKVVPSAKVVEEPHDRP
jgi:hypothetical protein